MKNEATTLNYSLGNEDWRSEWDALKINANDTILCVTGSGDRPLNLLPQNPAIIISVDNNHCQTDLLLLKMAALRMLPNRDYCSFLGLNNNDRRLNSWHTVLRSMPAKKREYWEAQDSILRKGILYQGKWEKEIRRLSLIFRILRGAEINRLFSFDDIQSQREYTEKNWDKWWWRATFEILCRKRFFKLLFGGPGLKEVTAGKHIYDCIKEYLMTFLAKGSFMLNLTFRGGLNHYDLPPYLAYEYQGEIRKRLDKIKARTADIIELMETTSNNSFTKYSLSDLSSYLDQSGFERMLDGMVNSAKPGARFCIRQYLTQYDIPGRYRSSIIREPELETALKNKDKSFVYSFIVGSVNKC